MGYIAQRAYAKGCMSSIAATFMLAGPMKARVSQNLNFKQCIRHHFQKSSLGGHQYGFLPCTRDADNLHDFTVGCRHQILLSQFTFHKSGKTFSRACELELEKHSFPGCCGCFRSPYARRKYNIKTIKLHLSSVITEVPFWKN